MKSIDTSDETIGMAQTIVSKGYQAVGVYLRPDRCSAAMVAELRHAGLKLWSIYEKGHPTRDSYFTSRQGTIDGHAAAAFADKTIDQPRGSVIYTAADYDPDHSDKSGPTIQGPISAYMHEFKSAVEQAGYVAGIYGSGRTCRILIETGLAKAGWLCVSSSFAEHAEFKARAAIIQTSVISRSWDGDDIRDPDLAGLF